MSVPREDNEKRTGFRSQIHGIVKELEPWGIRIAVIALIITFVQFSCEHEDRIEERQVRAWQLLATKVPGNSGKIAALQYLNKEDGLLCFEWLRGKLNWLHRSDSNSACVILFKGRNPLVGIDFSPPNNSASDYLSDDSLGAFLEGVDLRQAMLERANMSRAVLFGADLSGADLRQANLSKAILNIANLSKADLVKVDLSHACLLCTNLSGAVLADANLSNAFLRFANMRGANMRGANLDGADLDYADFRGVENLTQSQLTKACGNKKTKLPEGLTINFCDKDKRIHKCFSVSNTTDLKLGCTVTP